MNLGVSDLLVATAIIALLMATLALGMAVTRGRPVARLDPRALLALDRAGAYLRGLAGFDVHILTGVDRTRGVAVGHLDIHSRYRITWPDLMFAELTAEGRTLKFYFRDGDLTVFSPNLHKRVQIRLPPLMKQAMDFIYWRSGFRVPLARLIYFDSKAPGQKDLISARRLGSASLEGVECDVYAFGQAGLEVKVWIRQAPAPLPVRLEIRDRLWRRGSRHVAQLDWKTYANLSDTAL